MKNGAKIAKMDTEKTTRSRKEDNTKRNKRLLQLKKQNLQLKQELQMYIQTGAVLGRNKELSDKLVRSLSKCAATALYGADSTGITLLTFLSCRHKLCTVCNWDRQKKIRRKYIRWFDLNKKLALCDNGKVCTKSRAVEKGFTIKECVDYDLFHLMLSVPHTIEGWRGNRFYFRQICSAFNVMRKKEDWLQLVYGGQFGLETTRNLNGYHIHIHALLFVKKEKRSRNKLHRVVLYWWNRLTIDESNRRGAFTAEEIEAIRAGNRTLTLEDVAAMDPRGATIIHLETVYYLTKSGQKRYVSNKDSAGFIPAILETISYLFKPKVFCSDDDIFDVEAICDLLPEVYGNKSLYSKFGCLFGERSLNVRDDSLLEDMEELNAIDYETGEVLERRYFITNPCHTFCDAEAINLKRDAKVININVQTATEAVATMYDKFNKF